MRFTTFLLRGILGLGVFIFGIGGAVGQEVQDTVIARRLLNEAIELNKQGKYEEAFAKADSSRGIFAGVLGEETREVADALHQMGLLGYFQGNPDNSIIYWEKALEIRLKTLGYKHVDVAKSYNNLGLSYSSKGEYSKSIGYHQKALNIRLEILWVEHPDIAASYNNLGSSYSPIGEYDKAIEYHQKSLEIKVKTLGPEHPDVAKSYINLGVSYNSKGEYKKAIEYLQKSLKIQLGNFGSEHLDVTYSYNNLGGCYNSKGEYDKAIEYLQKALKILLKNLGPEHPKVAYPYINLGYSYNLKGEYDKAIWYHQKALKIQLKTFGQENPYVAGSFGNLGVVYYQKGEYEKAIVYLDKALKIELKTLGSENPDVAKSYLILGSCSNSKGEYDRAIEYFQKALEIQLKILGSESSEVAKSYINLGVSYNSKGEYFKAVECFNKALTACNYTVGGFSEVNSPEQLLESLNGLIRTLQTQCSFANTPHLFTQAHSYALQALAAIDYQNSTFTSLGTKSFWQTKNYDLYETAIAVTLEKAKVDKDETLRKTTFTYAEKSKASLLQSQIKESDALAFSGIPDSLIAKEHDLRIDLTWREKQRQEKLNAGLEETDTTVLAISGKLFDLRQEYDALKTRFEKDYPEYYRLKYDLSTASLAYVQDTLLQPNQTLLEYFVGDSSIFIFTVGKGKYEVMEVKKDFPLEDWVKQLQHGLYGYYGLKKTERTDKIAKQTILEYADIAPKLYEKLIAPVKDKLTGELIIVPDGVLGYVPFEALLTAPPGDATNFATYPFLVEDYRISYCYSATLLREMKDKKHKQQPTKSLVAFAPFYEGSYATADSTVSIEFDTLDNGQDTVLLTEVMTRKEYTKLEASGEETATAAKLWKGDYYLNADATEQRFNEVAGDYRIVHLSTHGIADARVGDYSYLAFAEVKDSIENELLYVRDLYNLQLNADLVVLSACETAQGELQRGEGIISLARAFAYAGAKSIVTTLWVVDDTASKDLMKEFYLQLRKGKEGENTKDAALQAAKLKLVNGKDAERKHPFFWAGFIAVGDMSAIK